MLDSYSPRENKQFNRQSAEDFFIALGFFDLFPLAMQIAREKGFRQSEIIEAICKVNEKYEQYPPTKSRVGWFKLVFVEKLHEARADIMAFDAKKKYR